MLALIFTQEPYLSSVRLDSTLSKEYLSGPVGISAARHKQVRNQQSNIPPVLGNGR